MFDFEVKIAKNKDELRAAQRLRYEVFHVEMGMDSASGSDKELDKDEYDRDSQHLVVIDKKSGFTVGTYRLLFNSDNCKIGFHSEKIFDMHNIKKTEGVLLELGRSCIDKQYRNNMVINLLWNGIASVVKEHNVKYLFGCPRLNSKDMQAVNEEFSLLKQKYYSPEKFRVYPLADNEVSDLKEDLEIENPRRIYRKLPPLIRGYLNLGAKVCGRPAVNPEFGSVVILMLLPTDKIVNTYRRHFLGPQ